jgi:hypothetical protein
MRLTDMPLWVQKTYWYFHGPITHTQPTGSNAMGASGIIWFLVIEFVLGCCIVLGLLGVDWLGASGTLNKVLKGLIVVIIGGLMLIKLLSFAGAA